MKNHFSDFVRRVKIPESSLLRKLRSILLLFIMLLGFNQAWAQDYFTINFKDNGGTSDGSAKKTAIADIISSGAEYVSSLSGVSNVYQARSGRGIKLGTSKATGSLTLNLDKPYKVYSIEVEARYYNTSERTLKIQDKEDYELTEDFETYEYNYDVESTWISSITIGSVSKRNYITSMTVYYETLDGIEIDGSPITDYNEGETFDPTGLWVNYVYSDNSKVEVPAEDITWTIDNKPLDSYHFEVGDDGVYFYIAAQVDNYTSNDLVVIVSVKGVFGIEVSGEPDQTTYQEGDEFDPTGLVVEYVYTDNTRVTVDPSDIVWSYYPDQSLSAGETSIEVMADVNTFSSDWYMVTGLTVTATLDHIELSGTPDKTDYIEGDIYDPAGLVVEYVYSDNSRVEVDPNDITWLFNPEVLSINVSSVTVTAQVGDMSDWNEYDITVSAPAYEKVTASQEDWSGEYLLVYEEGTAAYVWDGREAIDSYETAEIAANVIERPSGAAVLTIESVTGGYSIQISGDYNNGKYIDDNGSKSALKFSDNPYAATISYEGDWTKILFSQRCIRFNSASDQMRFRNYAATSQQPVQLYKRIDNRADAQLAWSKSSVSLKVGETFTAPTLSYAAGFDGAVNIEISSDNTNLATVDNGVVSLVAEASGTATIKALFSGNDNFRPAVASYTIHVSKTNPELAWTKSSDEIAFGDAWTAPTLDNPHYVAVSFESDNASVATVSNEGVILLAGGTGTAHISASFDGNAYYYNDEDVYTITVNPFNPVTVRFFAPVAWGSDVKAFTWSGPFPGDYPMTSTGNGRWFVCDIPENVPFLFYTGNWADQTVDIDPLSEDKCFTWTANRDAVTNKIVPAEVANCQMNYAIAGTLPGIGWDPTEFGDLDVYNRIEFTNLQEGTYQFKITNGTWNWNLGYAYVDQANSNITLSSDNDGNVQFATYAVMNVTIEYNPSTEKITVNGERVFNPNIEFNKTHVVIDGANITTTADDDSYGNIWSIAVEGDNVYHASYQSYEQVGSNASPASKITFATTLAELPYRAQVSDVTIRLSGNSSTSADVSIKVDDEVIGSGYLSGSEVVLISSNKVAIGQTLTITINNISSAIKCYGIEYAYETFETAEVKFFAPRDEGNKWAHVYARVVSGHGTQWPGEEITASKQNNWFTYRAEKGATIFFHDNMNMQTVNIEDIQSDVCYVPTAIDYYANPMLVSLEEKCEVDYYLFGSAALMGGETDWAQGVLLENGSKIFEDVQPTGDDSLVFKVNIGNWAWSIGNDFLNEECASIATAGENNNIQFKTDTKQNITVSYDPATGKICVDAELVKWPASIGSYEPVEMEINSSRYLYPQATVPENSEIHYEITEGADYISISDNIITANAVGIATVRAYIEESALYTSAETFFTVEVKKIPGTVYAGNMGLFVGDSETASFSTNISGYAASDVSYTIESGSEFITVDDNGLVTAVAKGNAVVRITIAEQPLYKSATNTFTVNVSKHEGQVSAKVNPLALKVNEQKNLEFETNITDYADADVSFTVLSGAEHIEIDNVNRTITGLSQGAAQVRITIASTATYEEATNTFTVNVSLNDGSISAEDMSVKVNEQKAPDYVTSNAGAAISYEVISGAEFAAVVGGQIRGLAAGVATVKISVAANAVYTAAENTFTVNVSLNDGSISAEDMSVKVNEQKAPDYVTSNEGAAISYEVISGAEFAAVVGGQIRGLAAGVATVKISVAANAVYKAAENTFTVNVSLNDGSISAEDMSVKVNEQKAPDYVTSNEGAAISYEVISGAEFAAVVGGQIRGLAAGVATVKISVAANAVYTSAENTFTVNVSLNESYVTVSDLAVKVTETKTPVYSTSNTGAAVTYEAISGAEFIEIDNVNGTITGKAKGNAVVKISVAATAAYGAVENTFNVSVTKYDATVSIDNLEMMVGDQITPQFETNVPGGVANYEFVSGDECVEINGTTITCTAAGSAILRISITGNEAYEVPNTIFTVNATAQPEPEPVYETVREGLQIGRYYTICMPNDIISVKGASFWTMGKRNAAATLAYLEEVQAPFAAGTPYIFLAEEEKLDVIYGEQTASTPLENGALRGTFDHMYQDDFNSVSAANNNSVVYMLVSNTLRIVSGGVSGNHLSPYRAYVLDNAFEVVNTAPQSAPGRRVLGMPMRPNTPTALDEDMNDERMNVQKRMIDGQLFIIVGDQMYDATGHLVK